MSVQEEDLLRIIDYLDGRLSSNEMMEFEARLADDAELEACFVSFEEMDQLQRDVERLRALKKKPRLSLLTPRTWVAAAALLLLSLGLYKGNLWSWFESPLADEPTGVQLAILPSGPDAESYHRSLGVVVEDGPELPESWSAVRGPGAQGRPDREYYDWIAPAQAERLATAFETGPVLEPLEYFTIAVRPEEESSAIVLLLDSQGSLRGANGDADSVAYPDADPWNSGSGRLLANVVQVLPRSNVEWTASTNRLADFAPGFLVPLGVEFVDVLVGHRGEALTEPLRVELMTLIAGLDSSAEKLTETNSRLRTWFESNGFNSIETRVLSKD